MLKTIALAGVFFFVSAISTASFTSAAPKKKGTSTQTAPSSPQPKGFCVPMGAHCAA